MGGRRPARQPAPVVTITVGRAGVGPAGSDVAVPPGDPRRTGAADTGVGPTGATQAGVLPTGATQAGALPTGATQARALPTGAKQARALPTGALPTGPSDVAGRPDGPGGPPVPGRRPRLRRRAALAALGVTLAGLGVADHLAREREFDRLLDRAGAAQAAVEYADGRIDLMLWYSSPVLTSDTASLSVRRSLQSLVSQAAREQVAPLRVKRAQVSAVQVLPWHRGDRRARAAYLAYLDRRLAYLQSVGRDVGALFVPHPELGTTLTAAQRALSTAAPDEGRAARVRRTFLPAA